MRSLVMLAMLLGSSACARKESAGPGSAAPPPPAPSPSATAGSAAVGSAAATPEPLAPPADDDGAAEVARMVVHDVGTKALGSQKIEESCVSVLVLPAGKWTIAAAHLNGCGDKTARSILWLYKRADAGKWSEDYVGQPPKCWKGVPADIAEAVTKATKIPPC